METSGGSPTEMGDPARVTPLRNVRRDNRIRLVITFDIRISSLQPVKPEYTPKSRVSASPFLFGMFAVYSPDAFVVLGNFFLIHRCGRRVKIFETSGIAGFAMMDSRYERQQMAAAFGVCYRYGKPAAASSERIF